MYQIVFYVPESHRETVKMPCLQPGQAGLAIMTSVRGNVLAQANSDPWQAATPSWVRKTTCIR